MNSKIFVFLVPHDQEDENLILRTAYNFNPGTSYMILTHWSTKQFQLKYKRAD